MTAHIEFTPPLQPSLVVETKAQAAERLQNELPVVIEPPAEDVQYMHAYVMGHKMPDGSHMWGTVFRKPSDGIAVDLKDGLVGQAIVQRGIDHVQADKGFYGVLTNYDGRWWEGSKAENDVQTSLREVYTLSATDDAGEERSLEILNCANSDLEPDEIEIVRHVIERLGAFTQGKLYDRVKGIVFAGDERFEDHDMGGFGMSGVLRLNLDELRKAKTMMPPRYRLYFSDDTENGMSITIAHEIGHAMDITSLDEADAHFIQRYGRIWSALASLSFSAFDNLPSWQLVKDSAKASHRGNWRHDVTVGEELGEHPPTGYAHEEPKEDTGESFAIASLGGNVSKIPMRNKLVHEMVERAEGRELGPHKVTVAKAEDLNGVYRPHGLDALWVSVFVDTV